MAIADATSTNTRTGATAFNACTNKLPSSIADFAAAGDSSASTIPAAIPKAICSTRLPDMIRSIADLVLMLGHSLVA